MARTDAACLDHGMDISFQEIAIIVDGNYHQRCMTRNTTQADVVGRAEITQAIGDETVLVDFYGTHHMGTVTIDNVSTMVYTEMGKFAQRTTVLTKEGLCTLWQVAFGLTLSTAVE